jgi:ABC-type glycerol-3-phosphate transport system permease component
MRRLPIRRRPGLSLLRLACLSAASLLVLFPIYWAAVTSLKDAREVFASPPVFWPGRFAFENYASMWSASAIPQYFLNTIVVAACSILCILLVSGMAAYALTRFDFRGRTAFLLSLLVGQIMPLTTLIIPLYLFWASVRLLDTHTVLIVNYAAFGIPAGVWLMTGFMKSIPRELDEAARVDGASTLLILSRVVLPLSQPGLVATGLSTLFWIWQELMISMTFVVSDDKKMLMAGVSTFITSRGIRWGELTAAGVAVILPVLVLYLLLRKALVRGLTAGALKS